MSELSNRYQKVINRIEQACDTYQRPKESVKLLAVSKTKPIEDIVEISRLGQVAFGENYVQEALEKIAAQPELEWHFIGPIQSNKTRPIAENFTWVHSIDRLKIAQRLNNQRPQGMPPLQVLLEVNISQETSKAGLKPDELSGLCEQLLQMPNIQLRGLMAIPQVTSDIDQQRASFARMRQLLESLQTEYPQAQLDTLSMGMSNDLEAAIAEGATMVRIGTDIFGKRDYSNL